MNKYPRQNSNNQLRKCKLLHILGLLLPLLAVIGCNQSSTSSSSECSTLMRDLTEMTPERHAKLVSKYGSFERAQQHFWRNCEGR